MHGTTIKVVSNCVTFVGCNMHGYWITHDGPAMWPPVSPSLTHPDFYFGGCVKEKVYFSYVCHTFSLCPRPVNAIGSLTADVFWVHTAVKECYFDVLCRCWCKRQSCALIASISSDTSCAKRNIIILCVAVQFWRLFFLCYTYLHNEKSNKLKIWGLQSSGIWRCVDGELVRLTLENEGSTFLYDTGNYSPKDAASHPTRWEFWITLLCKPQNLWFKDFSSILTINASVP